MGARLYTNARVFTGAGEDDFARAFRIEDGRFTWVGQEASPQPGEEVVDLAGRTVLPGLLDVHTHPAYMSTLVDGLAMLPPAVDSIEEMITTLRAHPAAGRGPEHWIEGWGYDESKLAEGRRPTRHDLDRVSDSQPVFVRRSCGHSAVCNSYALAAAGIDASTTDPAGGRYERDADGSPNGILTEPAATQPVERLKRARTRAETVRALAGLTSHYSDHGIVAVCDLMAGFVPDPLATFRHAQEDGLAQRVNLYVAWNDLPRPLPELTDADRTGRVRFSGVKLFMDGAMSNRTAWTKDAYPDSCDHGIPTITDEEFGEALAWCRANRVQVAVHAMGDRAIEHVLELTADLEPWVPGAPSVRIEHCSIVSDAMIDAIDAARMDYALVSHTIFFFAEYDNYEANLSAAQFAQTYPIRTFYERVPATALSSDCPATAWLDADDVFVSIKAAVVREAYNGADIVADQAITVPQAVLLYTSRAASVAQLEGLGRIAPGYEGSFVVLDRDIFTVPAQEIDAVRVAQTVIAGQSVFERG